MKTKSSYFTMTLVDVERMCSFMRTSGAVVAGLIAAWAIGTDLGWATAFPLSGGVMAHWQPWAIVAAVGEIGGLYLRSIASH